MNYKKFRYLILCEDSAHFLFAQGWLEAKGVRPRSIQLLGELPHEGSGKRYVQQKFDEALQKLRQKRGENIMLIVIQDADNEDCTTCLSCYRFENNDPVVIITPKWSIDTWAKFLEGTTEECLENTSYKPPHKERNRKKWKQLGKKLASMQKSSNMPISLQETWTRVAQKKITLT